MATTLGTNESKCRYQKAVYWNAAGYNNLGEVAFDSPQEIDVRIEKGLVETLDPQGNKIATPLFLNVPIAITVGSVVWLGSIEDLPEDSEDVEVEVLQVIEYEEIPDVKGKKFDRNVKLMKYKTLDTSNLPMRTEVLPAAPISGPAAAATASPTTIFKWDFGDVSKATYDAWLATMPTNGTTSRPQPDTNSYELLLPNDHKLGAVINYEMPTMDADGKLRSLLNATHHNDHTMLSPQNPNSGLLDWRYCLPGQNYRFRFGVSLETGNFDDPSWTAQPWVILWQLHPGGFGTSWADATNPPIALYVDDGFFSLHVRGSTQETPVTWTTNVEYPWALSTGYHTFIIDVRIDYSGNNALTKLTMDGVERVNVSHENGINEGGYNTKGSEFCTFGAYASTRGPETLFDYFYIEDF